MIKKLAALLLLGMAGTSFAAIGGGPGGSFINNANTLQPSATFYVSSGTVTNLQTGTIKFGDGTTQVTAAVGGGGASALGVYVNGVQVSSPTTQINFDSNFTGYAGSVGVSTISLSAGSTMYIRNSSTLQSGATFYVSSGTVNGTLNAFRGGLQSVLMPSTTEAFSLVNLSSHQIYVLFKSSGTNWWRVGNDVTNTGTPSFDIYNATSQIKDISISTNDVMTVNAGVVMPNLSASQPVKTNASKQLITSLINLTSDVSGTLPSGNLPSNVDYTNVTQTISSPKTFTASNTFSGGIFASSVTVTGLSAGNCVQTTTGGLLSTTGAPCGSGGGGSMSPGASYYVNVNPPSVQSGAFNISSGTVAGGLNVSTLTSLGSADFHDAGAFIRRSQVSATIPFASANVSGGITTNKFRIFDVYNFGSLAGSFGYKALNGNSFYVADGAGLVHHSLGTTGNATFGPSTALGDNIAFGEAIAVEKNIITTSQTLGATYYLVLGDTTGGSIVIDLPNLGGTGFGTLSNRIYRICKTDSSGNSITFTASGSADNIDAITISNQYECVDYYGYNTNPASSAGVWRAVGHSGQTSGGGGGSSALEVRSIFTGVGSSPTASILIGDGITTSVSGSTTTLAADFTKILRSTVAATTYATQVDINSSTTNISNNFNNYYSSGQTQNLFNLKTVDATTYATQANVTQSTTQLNSQFANYYSSGQSIGLFNLKTVDATTYATQANVTQSTTQLNSQFANYQTTGSALTTFILQSTGTNGVGQLVRTDGSGKLPAIDGSQLTNLPGGSGGGSWVGTATSTLDMAGYGIGNVASISFVAPGGSYIDVGTNTFVGFVVNGTTWYVNQSSITFGGSAASLGSNILVSSFPVTAVTAGSYTNTNLTVDAYGRITSASNGSGGSGGMYSFAISSNGVVVSSPAFNLSFTGPNLNVTVNGATNTVTYTSTVTTSGVPEGTNQYFTAARVNMALTNPTTIPFNVATSSVTPNPYGSGWNGSSRVVAEDAIYDKIESMSAGSGILATDTTTVSGSWTFLAPVEFRSTVTWTTTGGFDLQENSTFLMPRGMDVSSYTNKGSLSYNMTTNAVQVGTGTISRMIGGDVLQTFFASTGTYTPNPRMVTVKVTLTAPGGPTGSCTGTDSVVGGGGGGGTVVKTFTRAQIGASQAVNIPAAQAAGVAATVNASFGSFMTATSGGLASEGTAATVAISSIPGVGGGWSGGDYGIKGDDGTPGIIVTTAIGIGGNGGGSFQGGGTYGGRMDVVGRAGTGIGSGAGGCHAATATDRAGAAGGPGGAIIEEYLGG